MPNKPPCCRRASTLPAYLLPHVRIAPQARYTPLGKPQTMRISMTQARLEPTAGTDSWNRPTPPATHQPPTTIGALQGKLPSHSSVQRKARRQAYHHSLQGLTPTAFHPLDVLQPRATYTRKAALGHATCPPTRDLRHYMKLEASSRSPPDNSAALQNSHC